MLFSKALTAWQAAQIEPKLFRFQVNKLLCVAQVGSAWGITKKSSHASSVCGDFQLYAPGKAVLVIPAFIKYPSAIDPFAASSVQRGAALSVSVTKTVSGDVVVIPTTPCPTQKVIFAFTAAFLYSAGMINVPPLYCTALCVKSTPSLILPAPITHLTGTLLFLIRS